MGGPCLLRPEGAKVGRVELAAPCTDNFQVAPFIYEGLEFQSVEQGYQALKFGDAIAREKVRKLRQRPTENESAFGVRCWQAGHSIAKSKIRKDLDAVKVDLMYSLMKAKYEQHPAMQEELLATGDVLITGGGSTNWTGRRTKKRHTWAHWNGKIQMRIREELKGASPLLAELEATFAEYMAEEGGRGRAASPTPGAAPPGAQPGASSSSAAPAAGEPEEAEEAEEAEEVEGAPEVAVTFNAWDAEGDGVVTREKMVRGLRLVCPSLPEDALGALFDTLDTEGAGAIGPKEFASWLFGGPGLEAQSRILQALMDSATQARAG